MNLAYMNVCFYRYFFEEDDGPENATLVAIQSIKNPTKVIFGARNVISRNILFDHESGDQFNERLRELFRIVSMNRNIVRISLYLNPVPIPGSIVAGWLDQLDRSGFVVGVDFSFPEYQSDMQLLCHALQRDTTIKIIKFGTLPRQKPDIHLLMKALREKKGLHGLQFNGEQTTPTVLSAILEHLYSPDSHIQGLKLMDIENGYSNIDFANNMEKILTGSSSLTTFMMDSVILSNDIMIPILRGVVNSKITDFDFYPLHGLYEEDLDKEDQYERLQVIGKMNKLKCFSFRLDDFRFVSKECISSTLKDMKSLDVLKIQQSSKEDDFYVLKGIIQDMPNWERPCKLNLICASLKIELLPLLKYVQLENFICNCICHNIFEKLIDEIPSWRFLSDLTIHFSDGEFSRANESKFADTLYKNYSLKYISISNGTLCTQVQKEVDEILSRNEQLAKCQSNPEEVEFDQWPELFVLADPTGLNFSYECIRKIPDTFITNFFHCASAPDNLLRGCDNNCSKRESLSIGGDVMAKRAKQCTWP